MKTIITVIFVVIYYFILPDCLSLCEAQSLVDEYNNASRLVTEFRNNVESRFMSGDIEKMVDAFPVSEREKGAYVGWFNQKSQMKASYSIDSINLNLPILGFDSERALIQNGCFSIWFSDQDTSFHEFVRFREFILTKEGDSVVSGAFKDEFAGEYSKVVIKDSDFDVIISPVDETVKVRSEFKIASPGGELPSEISLFFRYPISLNSISCDSQELQGEHIFTRSAGLPVHQCIIKMPGTGEGGTRTIKLDYSLNYTNHSLSRKQVGFTGDNGYIVLEAGWYPWFESNFKTIPCKIAITLPEGLTAMAPGEMLGIEILPGGITRTQFSSEKDTWPFLVWGRYKRKIQTIGKSSIGYYLLENEKSDFDGVSGSFSRVWEHMSELLPLPDLDYQRIIEVSRRGGYGPEGNLLIDSDYINNNNVSGYETIELLAHELTHSWVNSLSPPSGIYSQFLSEGFATYMGAQVVGNILGEEEALKLWTRNFKEYMILSVNAIAPSEITEDLMYTHNNIYRAVVYFKGAYFFRLLEEFSGKEGFKEILKEVLSEDSKESFTMEELRKSAEKVNKEDYKYLFEDFLTTNCLPDDRYLVNRLVEEVSPADIEEIKRILESVFNFIDSNDVEGTITYYSTDSDFVNEQILNQIRSIVKNWKYNTQITGEPRLTLNERNIVQCFLPVKLNNNETETTLIAIIEMKKESTWKVISIKFR